MKKISVCLILLVFTIPSLFSQEKSNWRGPERNGSYPARNLLKIWPDNGPDLVWSYDKLGLGYSSPAVTDNQIFTVSTIDSVSYIFSFDLSGKLLWKTKMGAGWNEDFPGIRSTPTIYNGHGYVFTGFGVLFCFDTKNGNILWSKNIQEEYNGKHGRWGVSESIFIDGNIVYCNPGGKEINIVALNRINGELIWKSKGDGNINNYASSIIIEVNSQKFLISVTAHSLVATNVSNGETAWVYNLKSEEQRTTPIFDNGILYFSDGNKGMLALEIAEDAMSAKLLWENDIITFEGDIVNTPDYIYTFSDNGNTLYCVDIKTGEEVSRHKLSAKHQIGTIVVADEMIYCYTYSGTVHLFDHANGDFDLKSSFNLPTKKVEHCSYPVIKHGNLYIQYKNKLFVYNLKTN